MARLLHHNDAIAAEISAALAEFYGEQIPASALLLEHYLRVGCIPLRDPDVSRARETEDDSRAFETVSVELWQAASALGADFHDTCRHLHQLHATGQLTIDHDGTVELAHT